MTLWLPTILTLVVTIIFLVAERVFPGRELPNSKNWYARVLFVNALQIGITFGTNKLWFKWLSGSSLFHFGGAHVKQSCEDRRHDCFLAICELAFA